MRGMPNKIPKIIHLFWAGDTLPNYAINTIFSYLKNIQDDWRLVLWVTNPNCLYKTKLFRKLDALPKCFIIKDIQSLLQSNVFELLNKQYPQKNNENIYLQVKSFIEKELIGLGNPAAAKDACVPLILYDQGGYYFDIDANAIKKISEPKDQKYGVLVTNSGRTPIALASTKGHPFCAIALLSLIEYCQTLPDTLKVQMHGDNQNKFKHFSPRFFNLQVLRNRKDPLRNVLTCLVSGSMITAAFAKYAKKMGLDASSIEYSKDINFKKIDADSIEMGVKFNLNSNIPVKNFDDKSKIPKNSLLSFIFKFRNNFFKKKIEYRKDKETYEDEKITPWREDKKFKSFEAEDLKIYKKYVF